MVKITLHHDQEGSVLGKMEVEHTTLAYVEVSSSPHQEPSHMAVQVGDKNAIVYCPHGWVIVDGDSVTLKPHDGKGNATGYDMYTKFEGGKLK